MLHRHRTTHNNSGTRDIRYPHKEIVSCSLELRCNPHSEDIFWGGLSSVLNAHGRVSFLILEVAFCGMELRVSLAYPLALNIVYGVASMLFLAHP